MTSLCFIQKYCFVYHTCTLPFICDIYSDNMIFKGFESTVRCVCSLHMSKNMQLQYGISFTANSEWAVSVNVSANGFLHPASHPVAAGICSMFSS